MSDAEQIEPWAVAVESDMPPLVLEQINEYAVTVTAGAELLVVTAGEQGPPGPQGNPGPAGGSALQKVAAVPLSGHRLVFSPDGVAVDYADCGALDSRSNTLGLTLGAADAGAPVNIQRSGEVMFEGWAWSSGPVFLGHAGQVTQSLPQDAAFSLVVGFAMNATTLFLDMGVAITLEA
ncbi:conserved hypothetical protein [Pseudomonas knackmussii B13]|uniref:Uncharacterized protein n=1 Tax=Pseudomonas knackmussii (strain DSM 6978 / CCUG 54928 / LMG 23759 / B13) TaxID=1301098 RepID=A0A024HMN5_PSEKB|nr:hypothetical protein [Pseudomonas knackmussii]CDF86325.1 conserved hypothetical protein [Pseudomonas knackmussii B13]